MDAVNRDSSQGTLNTINELGRIKDDTVMLYTAQGRFGYETNEAQAIRDQSKMMRG